MQEQNQNIQNEWFCPITQEIMVDPVIADDGFTYQRKSIQNWFSKSNLSPITGLILSTTKVIPNRALKKTIEQYFQNNNSEKQQGASLISKANKLKNIKQNKIAIKNVKADIAQQNLELSVFSIQQQQEHDSYILGLQIIPPKVSSRAQRKPVSLICVLDISQSMNTDAVKDGKDKQSHGFSRLDLVKHSMKTILEFLETDDELTLIVFNTNAKCIMSTTKMNNAGKKTAQKKILELQGAGTTNIWEGLRISLQQQKKINHKNKNVYTLLLTDGEPNLNPPRGIIPTLKKYIEIEQLLTPNIHVFGYGYQLDTKLLQGIAKEGSGSFAYIPDCSMVGTVFINFMSNCLATITNRLQISCILPKQIKPVQILGYPINQKLQYNIGCIQYGQPRIFLVKIKSQKIQQSLCRFQLKYGSKYEAINAIQFSSDFQKIKIKRDQVLVRWKYLTLLHKCLNYGSKIQLALTQIQFFYQWLKKVPSCQTVEAILLELKHTQSQNQGQVQKAFLKLEWYNKWGKHYIPSLFLSHLLQVCTNFKDPALQLYGGQLFKNYQNKMDTIFIKMQPPKPSAKKQKDIIYKPAPVNMSHYYNNYGGCIDGQCEVNIWRLVDSKRILKQVKLKDVIKGDRIQHNSFQFQIQCLVQTKIFGFVQMVKINNLIITPWHPIEHNGKWVFPIDIKEPELTFVQFYYNFVLKKHSSSFIQICGIKCIGLGHQIQDNQVTFHPYLSNQKVLYDLQQRRSDYERGKVRIMQTIRSQKDGKIIKFKV